MATTVGIIGLGIMGGAIARNLLAAGVGVCGYDIDARCIEALGQEGIAAGSAAEAAQGADLVLTSLPSAEALDETVTGLLAANARGLVVAELSTLPLDAKEKARVAFAGGGITLLDCPLSGTGAQAATRDLAVYASGPYAAYERAEPVFRAFARASHYLGPFGNGSKMKFIANLLVAVHNVASAEAMVLGMKAGLVPEVMVEVIASGAGTSRIFELRAPLMAKRDYRPTMKVDVWQKDMAIIADFAKSFGVPTPTFAASAPLYDAAQARGLGGKDTAAVAEVIAAEAGLKR